MSKLWVLLLLSITSCASVRSEGGGVKHLPFNKEFVYLSSDLAHVAVFSKQRTRFGPTDLAIANPEWPSSPATYFETSEGVQCLSIGDPAISSQYAVKRPIKMGEKYNCFHTLFR